MLLLPLKCGGKNCCCTLRPRFTALPYAGRLVKEVLMWGTAGVAEPVGRNMSSNLRVTPLVAMCLVLGISGPAAVQASMQHPGVVSANPVDHTPSLVPTSGPAGVPIPKIDAIGQVGNTIFAGGLFTLVTHSGLQFPRNHFMAFDANTGVLRQGLLPGYSDPNFNNQIWAIATLGNSVFVGGEFTSVNGIARRGLVKLDATTGAVDPAFNPPWGSGNVRTLKIWNGRLIVGGGMPKRLLALNVDTGADTGYINLGITDPIPDAWGNAAVYQMAINPAGTKLVATGNFRTVSGQPRTRMFIANLGGPNAVLDDWYYPGFEKACATSNPRRRAYLQGVDFSPDGSYFVVAATGFRSVSVEDLWPTGSATYHTVCDAVARFNLSDDQRPVWINYTGGDSLFAAVATGAAVYTQGHNRWMNNPFGSDSAGPGAVNRRGMAAVHPATGALLPWNPNKPARVGGTVFLVTEDGLWVGSDSLTWRGEPRRGIGFAPLP